MARIDRNIDVWYDGKIGREETSVFTIQSGKILMKRLQKEGKKGIVMYLRGSDGSNNRQYYFENGRIKYDKDDY